MILPKEARDLRKRCRRITFNHLISPSVVAVPNDDDWGTDSSAEGKGVLVDSSTLVSIEVGPRHIDSRICKPLQFEKPNENGLAPPSCLADRCLQIRDVGAPQKSSHWYCRDRDKVQPPRNHLTFRGCPPRGSPPNVSKRRHLGRRFGLAYPNHGTAGHVWKGPLSVDQRSADAEFVFSAYSLREPR
jgi:hypothetical protein